MFGLKFNKAQNKKLSDIWTDVGKLVFGAMVLGYFLPSFAGKIKPLVMLAGFAITSLCFILGLWFLSEVEE